MYRLVATAFVAQGWSVAIPGYRTYPDGTAFDQVADCELAATQLTVEYPQLLQSVTVVGHSSGTYNGNSSCTLWFVVQTNNVPISHLPRVLLTNSMWKTLFRCTHCIANVGATPGVPAKRIIRLDAEFFHHPSICRIVRPLRHFTSL